MENTQTKRRTTRTDVATHAGVSPTTVTFVLNDRYDYAIPETTRKRVKDIARALGYRPNVIAQSLVSGKTNAITVTFPNLIVPHYSRVLQALERFTNANGYHLIARTVGHGDPAHVRKDLRTVINSPNDGVILVDMPDTYKGHLDEIMPYKKPVVSMGIYETDCVDCVSTDLQAAATATIEHLLAANPKRLAFFCLGRAEYMDSQIEDALRGDADPRIVAYCRLMDRTGRRQELIVGEPGNRRTHMQTLHRYIAEHGCPDAIFGYDDEIAVSAHFVLRELGFRVPQDVLLTGCDGNIECEFLQPTLSTIMQPVDEMCEIAWDYLTKRLEDPDRPIQYTRLEAQLNIRQSSKH